MERKRVEVLTETADWAVCLKPVGVESEKEMPELLSAMLGGKFFPVHRLDLNVGGLTVYARNGEAAARLSELIRTGSFRKAYMALVHGNPPASGRMEDLLWKDARAKKVYVVQRMRRGVKKAALSYETLWTDIKKTGVWCWSDWKPDARIRSGCSFPPAAFRWWEITSTVPGTRKPRRGFSPAESGLSGPAGNGNLRLFRRGGGRKIISSSQTRMTMHGKI